MKKGFLFIVGIMLVGIMLAVTTLSYASTDPNYTDNLSLWKPSADDRTAALPDANSNWDTIDTAYGGASGKPYFSYTDTTTASTGDTNITGLKVRTTNTKDQPTGYVLRGADIEARVTSGGEATNVHGATITAHTNVDTNSRASSMYGLKLEAKANGTVSTEIYGLDIRMFRQAAIDPSGDEIGLRIRNANTSGTGIDSAISVKSDGSGDADDFGYGIDLNSATIDTADIRLQNGETISNATDGSITIDGFLEVKSSADTAAPNSSLYYSTDQSKLVYKDSGGTVRDLW